MSRRGGTRARGVLLVSVLLAAAALGTDLLWFRPAAREVEALTARREALAGEAAARRAEREEAGHVVSYVRGREEPSADWMAHYRGRDALQVLESLRRMGGLDRRDLSFVGRERVAGFERTTYFMILTGSFERQMAFLRSLEQAIPLIAVDSFILEDQEAGGAVTLRINVSVHTLREEGA